MPARRRRPVSSSSVRRSPSVEHARLGLRALRDRAKPGGGGLDLGQRVAYPIDRDPADSTRPDAEIVAAGGAVQQLARFVAGPRAMRDLVGRQAGRAEMIDRQPVEAPRRDRSGRPALMLLERDMAGAQLHRPVELGVPGRKRLAWSTEGEVDRASRKQVGGGRQHGLRRLVQTARPQGQAVDAGGAPVGEAWRRNLPRIDREAGLEVLRDLELPPGIRQQRMHGPRRRRPGGIDQHACQPAPGNSAWQGGKRVVEGATQRPAVRILDRPRHEQGKRQAGLRR